MSADNEHARFAHDWLSLREPADHAARDAALTARAARWLSAFEGVHTIVDLGSGRGSNLCYLAPRLPGPQRWRLIDHDPKLLARAKGLAGAITDREQRAVEVTTETLNLTDTQLETALAGARLVTAAALFDLVTEAWIERVSRVCAQGNAAALCVLSVDGMIEFAPSDRDDRFVSDLLRAHQRRDKSFGAALGVEAPTVLERCFRARGYAVHEGASIWHIDARTHTLGCALIDGWRDAACEQSARDRAPITAWAKRRQRALCAGALRIDVGHRDLFATPPGG